MKRRLAQWFIILMAGTVAAAELAPAAPAPKAPAAKQPGRTAEEKQACVKNLKLIYGAIQAFQADHPTLTLTADRLLAGGKCTITSPHAATTVLRLSPLSEESYQTHIAFPLEYAGHLVAVVEDRDGHFSKDTIEADLHPTDDNTTEQLRDFNEEMKELAEQTEQLQKQMNKTSPGSPAADALRKKLNELVAKSQSLRKMVEKRAASPDNARSSTSQPTSMPSLETAPPTGIDGTGEANSDGFTMSSRSVAPADSTTPSSLSNGGKHSLDRKDAVAAPAVSVQPAIIEETMPGSVRSLDVGTVRGEIVPGRYKEITEAYFRRIAEENR